MGSHGWYLRGAARWSCGHIYAPPQPALDETWERGSLVTRAPPYPPGETFAGRKGGQDSV